MKRGLLLLLLLASFTVAPAAPTWEAIYAIAREFDRTVTEVTRTATDEEFLQAMRHLDAAVAKMNGLIETCEAPVRVSLKKRMFDAGSKIGGSNSHDSDLFERRRMLERKSGGERPTTKSAGVAFMLAGRGGEVKAGASPGGDIAVSEWTTDQNVYGADLVFEQRYGFLGLGRRAWLIGNGGRLEMEVDYFAALAAVGGLADDQAARALGVGEVGQAAVLGLETLVDAHRNGDRAKVEWAAALSPCEISDLLVGALWNRERHGFKRIGGAWFFVDEYLGVNEICEEAIAAERSRRAGLFAESPYWAARGYAAFERALLRSRLAAEAARTGGGAPALIPRLLRSGGIAVVVEGADGIPMTVAGRSVHQAGVAGLVIAGKTVPWAEVKDFRPVVENSEMGEAGVADKTRSRGPRFR